MCEQEVYYYDRWTFWDQVVNFFQKLFRQKKHFAARMNVPSGYIITNSEMVHINLMALSGERVAKAITWDQLLMIKDSLYSRC